jgi:hypothetical protein
LLKHGFVRASPAISLRRREASTVRSLSETRLVKAVLDKTDPTLDNGLATERAQNALGWLAAIQWAYETGDYQISGPAWVTDERSDEFWEAISFDFPALGSVNRKRTSRRRH